MTARPAAPGRTIAYLVNVYPAPSHTFIRREIAALEQAGWRVLRFTHRRFDGDLVDAADREELARTECLRSVGGVGAALAVARALLRRPLRTLCAFWSSMALATSCGGRYVAHVGYFVFACVLAERLRRLGCRHVHAHFGTNPTTVAWLASRLGGVGYSFTCHGPHEFVEPDRLGLERKVREASFVVAVSRHGRTSLERRFPRSAGKLVRVPCGLVAARLAEPVVAVPSRPRLVAVGRLDEQKNPMLLVDAACELRRRGVDFELRLVGDGSLRETLERQIRARSLSGSVQLVGWATGAAVRAELVAARALVLASDDEGLPVAIMEAFAAGRPAIATDVGGVGELVRTGSTGWLVPRRDAVRLAEAMQDALHRDPACLARLADAGRALLGEHDAGRCAAQLDGLFDRALDERRAR